MLEIKGLSKTFGLGSPDPVKALNNINLSITQGEFVIILGDNGSGKSTLFNCIAGTVFPDEGSIMLNELNITAWQDYKRAGLIARIFQNPTDGTAPDLSVSDNYRLAELRADKRKIHFGKNQAFKDRLIERLKWPDMGLEHKINALTGSLSGGQRQVLSLLMATAVSPQLLLMDEPTAALDPGVADKVMKISERIIREQGITAIMITHQLSHAVEYGDRILFMRQGSIVKNVKKDESKKMNIAHLAAFFYHSA
jgi:putative ABC transport system ATP-binding protein